MTIIINTIIKEYILLTRNLKSVSGARSGVPTEESSVDSRGPRPTTVLHRPEVFGRLGGTQNAVPVSRMQTHGVGD